MEVLKGAKILLGSQRIKAIQFEFNEMNIVSHSTFKDFWDLLSKNYKLYRIVNSNFLIEIKKYHPLRNEIYGYQNIIAKLK